MQKINLRDFSRPLPSARNACLLPLAYLASSSALAYGGVPMASVSTALALAIAAAVLLVLDGLKRQFEERAFFGILAGVAAVLMAAGMLLGGSSRNYSTQDDSTAAVVETASIAAVSVAMQGSDLELRVGDQTANGDAGLDLPGTQTRLKVSCYQDVSVHLLSKQALPESLTVKIQTLQLEPNTRLAKDTVDASNSEGFERIFKMDTRCDLLKAAAIEVEGLKMAPANATASAGVLGNKITVQISKY
jgi:hypothetical protein